MRSLKQWILDLIHAIVDSQFASLGNRVLELEQNAYDAVYKYNAADFATMIAAGQVPYIIRENATASSPVGAGDALMFNDGSIYALLPHADALLSASWVQVKAPNNSTNTVRVVNGVTDTITEADLNNFVRYTSATGVSITCPNNFSKPGTVTWIQDGAGQLTFSNVDYLQGVGITGKSFAQHAVGCLTYADANQKAKLSGEIS